MKTKPRTFYSLKDLEQITSEMAGVNEFTSNASGKEELDSLFEKYQKAQSKYDAEYDAIQKIIDDAKLKIEKLNDEILIYNLATNTTEYQRKIKENQRKTEQAKLERIISVNQRKLNKLKADIAVIKQQYNNLKKIYDAQVSEEQRIQAEAFKVEQELKAAENARIYGEQMQKKLQEEEAAAKKKLQEEEAAAKQKEKTKKLIIGGIAALLLIGGIVIGVKKGWFKKK